MVQDVFPKIVDVALFVMSSEYVGFLNSLVEARAFVLPVILVGDAKAMIGVMRELPAGENLC